VGVSTSPSDQGSRGGPLLQKAGQRGQSASNKKREERRRKAPRRESEKPIPGKRYLAQKKEKEDIYLRTPVGRWCLNNGEPKKRKGGREMVFLRESGPEPVNERTAREAC